MTGKKTFAGQKLELDFGEMLIMTHVTMQINVARPIHLYGNIIQ